MMIAVVGSGGKTTLIKNMAAQYRAQGKTVLITPSTHMFVEEDTLLTDNAQVILRALRETGSVMAGVPDGIKIRALSKETFDAVCGHADVVLVDGDAAGFENYVRDHIADGEAVVAADSLAQQFSFCNRLSFGKTANAEEESRALFSILREADDRGYTRVYIQLPPPEGGYLALYNRLIRAAGGRIVHIK